MRRLTRHIGITVFRAVMVALIVFVGLDAVAELIDEVGALQREYRYLDAAVYVLTKLPSTVYEYLPNASLIGCIYGLGSLAGNSEVTVMRAAGVSLSRIVYLVMRPVMLFVFFGIVIGEYVSPYTDQIATATRDNLRNGASAQDSASGLWIREGSEFMHFNAVFPGGILFGVTRYQFDQQQKLIEASFSTRATYNVNSGNWLEENVAITRFDENKTVTERQITRDWVSGLSPDVLTVNILPPSSLPILILKDHITFLRQQGATTGIYELAFWHKLLQPAATLALVIVAISFVFGPLREATMGFRIFVGVLIGISFKMLQDLLGPFSIVFELPILFAVLAPILVSVAVGAYLLRRSG